MELCIDGASVGEGLDPPLPFPRSTQILISENAAFPIKTAHTGAIMLREGEDPSLWEQELPRLMAGVRKTV